MAALRTQVYFTVDQRRRLDARARSEGKTMAEVVREAVDLYVADDGRDLRAALDEAFGSLPDLEVPPRSEWDRGHS